MKIAMIQLNAVWENKEATMAHISNLLSGISPGCDLMVFPELTLTGFTMNSRKFSEEVPGPSSRFFAELARKFNTHIMAGVIQKSQEQKYNALLHFDRSGEIAAQYKKIHPFRFSGENRHYAPGESVVISKTDQVKTGLSICYDLRFPELYRSYARARCELIVNIANWPEQRIQHWKILSRARAVENQAFFVGVNRSGRDKGNLYPGKSVIVNPMGEVIVQLDEREQIAEVEIDMNRVAETRDKLPFLQDMVLV